MNKDHSYALFGPGLSFLIGGKQATIVDEDQLTFTYIIGTRFRCINKPVFFERISKSQDGVYYLYDKK